MFVFWQFICTNGLSNSGKVKTKTYRSKVHRLEPGLTTRTLCKLKIPKEAEVTRIHLATELPEDRQFCVICEHKA